jgi:multimeric flavodoxin WrbA
MPPDEVRYRHLLDATIKYLKGKRRVLLLTTSTRFKDKRDVPKSTKLAKEVARRVGARAQLLDVSRLKIYPCEGNVSTAHGNNCGPLGSVLKNKRQNPTGFHRCWASINNPDDELWRISKPLFGSDAVVFFGSVRWGQANSIYQTLIERLTWIENRHSTLGEDNVVKDIDAGIILVGQNWRGQDVASIQKQVLSFFGFKTPAALTWNWQFTTDAHDETAESYAAAPPVFADTFLKKR